MEWNIVATYVVGVLMKKSLIGYQIKEFLDPGYWERMKANHSEKRGQTYYMKPGSIVPEFNQ